jgi:hypothetical protein
MNTTTNKFQAKPDYYTSEKDCTEGEKKIVNTNPRYKFFSQTHFTAGDIDQFSQYRDPSNGSLEITDITTKIHFPIPQQLCWNKYIDLDVSAVDNTFKYLFNKFKKGIFIKIKNGQVRVFLPFSNKNFTNEWSDRIRTHPKYGDFTNFMKHITSIEGYKFYPNKINKFIDTWYANNCLLRSEFPVFEGDTNVPNTSDMFLTLCQTRQIPDMEFFVNRRDFPLLKTDSTEPYNHIYDSDSIPLLSHNYPKYSPILSMVSAQGFADIPIPTGDDWARVSIADSKYFAHSSVRSFTSSGDTCGATSLLKPWTERIPTAIFRGASTGVGVTIQTNPRLRLASMSKTSPKDSNGIPYLDAGITKWNLRPRKISGEKYLQTIDIQNLPFTLSNFVSPQEQTMFKYIINVQGHVASYRLSRELESGSCILLVECQYKLWYSPLLVAYTHYVPVKSDLSDLFNQIEWCKTNDSKCKQIAENALTFSKTYLTKDGILDYLQTILSGLKKVNGTYLYNQTSPREVQLSKELKYIHKIPKTISIQSFLSAKKTKEIFSNSNTSITEYTLSGKSLVQKKSNSVLHEAFVSQFTNTLPNFVYTHGYFDQFILTESVKGITFSQYIKSEEFNMEDFTLVLAQIALALCLAQEKCQFVHNDLTPWNIMIHTLDKPKNVKYTIKDSSYSITTRIIPTIIDMGRSHVVYRKEHYGNINMFSTSTVQDIITLLVTSISDISNFQLDKNSATILITLANFLAPSGYCSKPFSYNITTGLAQIKYFFIKASKYTELTTSDKYELHSKTPLDFINYITQSLQVGKKIQIVEGKSSEMPITYKPTFSESTFLYPEKILNLLQDTPLHFTEVDITTLKNISKKIFSENLEFIKDNTNPDLQKYKVIYNEILKFC